jgi:hypothetical protein
LDSRFQILSKINIVRLGDPRQTCQLEVRPGRQRDSYDRFRQHASRMWRRGGQMRDGALDSLIHRETAAHVTDASQVVVPVHGIAALGLSHPSPMLHRVERIVVKRLVSEVGGFQYDRRRTPDEAVLSHGTAFRDG